MDRALIKTWSERAVGRNILANRKAAGLSQVELGQLLLPAVTRHTVSRWEKGHYMPRRGHLLGLSMVFGVTVSALMYDHPTPTSPPSPIEETAHG